jgi:hypothetical protein
MVAPLPGTYARLAHSVSVHEFRPETVNGSAASSRSEETSSTAREAPQQAPFEAAPRPGRGDRGFKSPALTGRRTRVQSAGVGLAAVRSPPGRAGEGDVQRRGQVLDRVGQVGQGGIADGDRGEAVNPASDWTVTEVGAGSEPSNQAVLG